MAPHSRAQSTTARRCPAPPDAPVGLPGSFTQTTRARAASSSLMRDRSRSQRSSSGTGTARRPARRAPISYVGYATPGKRTVSREGSRSESSRGNDATSSLVPMHARTASGDTATPNRRPIHAAAASLYAGAPIAGGYPVAPAAASASARCATSGIASTGVPTEQSTRPPGTASATARRSRKRSCGYGGGTNPGSAINRRLPGTVRRSGGCAAAFAVPHHELAEAADTRLGDSGTDAGLLIAVHLHEHVTFAMERGNDVAPFVRHGELDDRVERPQSGGENLVELLYALAGRRRDRNRVRVRRHQVVDDGRIGEVDLVHDEQLGLVARADLTQHGAHCLDLLLGVGRAGVDDVDEHVDLRHLFEC